MTDEKKGTWVNTTIPSTLSDKLRAERDEWNKQNNVRLASWSAGGRRTLKLLAEARDVWSMHCRDNSESHKGDLSAGDLIALASLIEGTSNAGEWNEAGDKPETAKP